jgi:hypothetical protein
VRWGSDGGASVWRRCLRAEWARYAGRGNGVWAGLGGWDVGAEDAAALDVLVVRPPGPAPLGRRVRVGEVEVEGRQGLSSVLAETPVLVPISARITRGSKVGCERGEALLGIADDNVKDLAVGRVGDMPGMPIPTAKPVLALLPLGIPQGPDGLRVVGGDWVEDMRGRVEVMLEDCETERGRDMTDSMFRSRGETGFGFRSRGIGILDVLDVRGWLLIVALIIIVCHTSTTYTSHNTVTGTRLTSYPPW